MGVVVDDEVLLVLSCATNEHTTQWNSKAPKPKHERHTTNATSSKRQSLFTDKRGGSLTEDVEVVELLPPSVLVTELPAILTYAKTPLEALPQLSSG